MTRIGVRNLWFQTHKWIGLILAVLIIPISLTGSALVWHEPLEHVLYPERFAVAGPAALAPAAYAEAARAVLANGERLSSLQLPRGAGEPVVASASQPRKPGAQGRPGRTTIFLDPADARVIDRTTDGGILQVLHVLHGSLMVPGLGRQIVGWIGVAMLLSSLTGLWIWWPTVGSFVRGLRWRRHRNLDSNLHHQLGFWIALPLAVLSLTGAWISFPMFFGSLVGEGGGRGRGPDRAALFRARPLEQPETPLAAALAAAAGEAEGRVVRIGWPTDLKPDWTVEVAMPGGPATVTVKDAGGAAALEPAGEGRPRAGTARLMRRIHDGNGMGIVWQVIIFVGGIIPAILAVTGIIMWWRARGWRGELKQRRRRAQAKARPA